MLEQIPPAPKGKTGWPWTEESPKLPEKMPDGSVWPRISIVTPSFNQAQFLEETIRSVLLQGYPNLEYMIIDGGSTDNSVEIIQKYAPWLSYWVSEPDRGQAHAINKGFSQTTGDIVAWINSDDYYLPGTFATVAQHMKGDESYWVIGVIEFVDKNNNISLISEPARRPKESIDRCFRINTSMDFHISQPGNFWAKKLLEEIGLLSEQYNYCMDLEWILRLLAMGYRPTLMTDKLARFRLHPTSKTVSSSWAFDFDRGKMY